MRTPRGRRRCGSTCSCGSLWRRRPRPRRPRPPCSKVRAAYMRTPWLPGRRGRARRLTLLLFFPQARMASARPPRCGRWTCPRCSTRAQIFSFTARARGAAQRHWGRFVLHRHAATGTHARGFPICFSLSLQRENEPAVPARPGGRRGWQKGTAESNTTVALQMRAGLAHRPPPTLLSSSITPSLGRLHLSRQGEGPPAAAAAERPHSQAKGLCPVPRGDSLPSQVRTLRRRRCVGVVAGDTETDDRASHSRTTPQPRGAPGLLVPCAHGACQRWFHWH